MAYMTYMAELAEWQPCQLCQPANAPGVWPPSTWQGCPRNVERRGFGRPSSPHHSRLLDRAEWECLAATRPWEAPRGQEVSMEVP